MQIYTLGIAVAAVNDIVVADDIVNTVVTIFLLCCSLEFNNVDTHFEHAVNVAVELNQVRCDQDLFCIMFCKNCPLTTSTL